MKTEYPHLIECPADLFNSKLEQDLVAPPASPDAIDKENVMMTKIEPQIYVGMYSSLTKQSKLHSDLSESFKKINFQET